ncbi:MAG: hypothetical protein BV456_03130 [Thermoplasmata archaeon M8B2D]|nr:MAG: hypothetical protein BV456_03130 [Thermoplasmata archaeon M8B2D]
MVVKSLQRLSQIAKPDSFDDQKTAIEIENSESASENLAQFFEALLSQIKRIIHGNDLGNWYDDPISLIGDVRWLVYKQDVACLSSDSIGDWMCIRGDRVNGKWRVQKADPRDIDKMPAVGVLISKATPTVGVIQLMGPCELFTSLDYTKPIAWLGDYGLQYTPPIANHGGYVMAQKIGKPMANNIFWINGTLEMIKRID